jgi:glycosyltransferase involved in cell wall biosynthesis
VRALAGLDSRIAVKGFVERPQAYLERCGMAIAPMRVGSGQLFKVMEAMACGAPLIATRLATAGTEAESERHFLAAETPEAFARQALRLMREPTVSPRRHAACSNAAMGGNSRSRSWWKSIAR